MRWDELEVKEALRNYICKFMYIYDIQENIVILSVYSTSPLEKVLAALEQLYGKLKYRAYMAQGDMLPIILGTQKPWFLNQSIKRFQHIIIWIMAPGKSGEYTYRETLLPDQYFKRG
jgi:hypothetical protein